MEEAKAIGYLITLKEDVKRPEGYVVTYEGYTFNAKSPVIEIESEMALTAVELMEKFKGTSGILSISGEFKIDENGSNTKEIKD